MKITLGLVITVLFTIYSSAQSLQVEQELNTSYYEFHDLKINLTRGDINVSKNNEVIFSEKLIGKKIFKSSPAENYFLIANYQFSNGKYDYPVDVRVFDKNGELDLPYKFLASFDLPHPLLAVNDNGVLALFDPLSFKVKLLSEEFFKEIELEKDNPFEMEKATFLEMNEDFLYVLTSQRALDITENASNVTLYKINIFDLIVDKKMIDYNTPTLLKIIGGQVLVSGVTFEDFKPVGKTIKFDMLLNQLAQIEKIIEKIIPNGKNFYAKYFNTMYSLDNNLKLINEKILPDNERIFDIAILNDNLVVITHVLEESYLYHFSSELNVDFKSPLPIFKVNNLESLSISENHLIIRYNSKSVKIKTIRN